MSLFCPNRKSVEYEQLSNVFDDALAHYIWNKNGGNPIHLTIAGEPSKLYQDLLEMTGDEEKATLYKGKTYFKTFMAKYGDWINDPKPGTVDENGEPTADMIRNIFANYPKSLDHPDSRIQANIDKYGRSVINDWNNDYVWEQEKKHKLVRWTTENGKEVKHWIPIDFVDATVLVNDLRNEGFTARMDPIYSLNPKMANMRIVRVAKRIGLPKDKEREKGIYNYKLATGKDRAYVNNTIVELASGKMTVSDLLRSFREDNAKVLQKRPDLLAILDLYDNTLDKVGKVSFRESDALDEYLWHDVIDNTHVISMNTANLVRFSSREAFMQGMLHELAHPITTRALENPVDDIDKAFNREVTDLYDQLVARYWEGSLTFSGANKNKGRMPYGLRDKYEFVSEFLTNPQFATYLKMIDAEETKGWFRKLFDIIVRYFRDLAGKTVIEDKKTIYSELEKAFTSFMAVQTDFSIGDSQMSTYSTKLFAKMKDDFDGLKGYEKHRKGIEKALRGVAKLFDDLREDHIYTHLETNTEFISTTQFMSKKGYGFKEYAKREIKENKEYFVKEGKVKYAGTVYKEGDTFVGIKGEERYKIIGKIDDKVKAAVIPTAVIRGGNLGSAIHKTIEGQIKDIVNDIYKDTGFSLTRSAEEDVRKILEAFRGETVTVLSEVIVADIERNIAGTVDLVIIDEKGRVHIYDFKNKEGGFKYWDSTNFSTYSDKTKYKLQLSIYKHIIEKSLGIRVATMNIVMMQPTVEDSVITGVELNRDITETGVYTFKMHSEGFNIYQENKIKWGEKKGIENKTRQERLDAQNSFTTDEYLDFVQDKSRLDDVDALLESTKKSLKDRLDLLKARYSFGSRKNFEAFYDSLDEAEEASDAFVSIISFAAHNVNEMWDEYMEVRDSGKKFTPEMLYRWRDTLTVYEKLEDLQQLMQIDTTIFSKKSIVKTLERTISRKNTLTNLFKKEGKYLIARWLTPYYNGVKVKFREKAGEDYRRDFHRMRTKENMSREAVFAKLGTEASYIEELYAKEEKTLEERTYKLLLEELTVASRDVGDIARWLQNMLDTRDIVSAALVQAFVEADERARLKSIEKRTEMIEELRALQKAYPKGKLQGEIDYYRWMLEFNEKGDPTQHLIKPWLNTVFEEERKLRKELSKELTKQEVNFQIRETREGMMIFDDEQFNKVLDQYLLDSMKGPSPKITKREYKRIQEARYTQGLEVKDLAKQGKISDNASEYLLSWVNNNMWYFYTYDETYQNPEWNKLMREVGVSTELSIYEQSLALKESKHPKARFYNYINKLANEADQMLPYSFRLGYRLPGVAKSESERIKEGQNPADLFTETMKADFLVRPEDVERGNEEFKDDQGNVKMFLPIHYTARLEEKNQSYDIAGIYYKFWESGSNYSIKRNILPSMEMTRYFVDTRAAAKRNALGNIVERLRGKGNVDDDTEEIAESAKTTKTNTAAQLGDWFEMAVYGKKSKVGTLLPINENLTLDLNKFVDAANSFTSVNLLGLNLVQGTANIILGETMQAIDAIAGEHVDIKNLTRATLRYSTWLPGMMGDIGRIAPEHVGSLIIERFNVLHDNPSHVDMSKVTRTGQLANTNTLFFVQKSGEHWLQGRFLFAMLDKKRAFDKEGNDIGTMLDQYYAKDGRLVIKPEVDLEKSGWTESDQTAFMRKTKGILTLMHGEYSDLGRVAIQRLALGRLAYMFRKFVEPGIRRRYSRRDPNGYNDYSQRLQQSFEGSYNTTMRFAGQMIQDLYGFKFALMAEDWAAMSEHERANVIRTISEVAFLVAAIIMANFLYKAKDRTDDDDEARLYAFFSYQFFRLKTELLFFSPKLDESMSILRSPMASMSILENIIKLTGQMFNPGEVYERGPWKGELKIKRTAINFVPVYKQYYKIRDVEEQITWFKN